MGKGYVRITNSLIKDALQFPIDWEIEDINPSFDQHRNKRQGESTMLISGADFPKANNRGEAEDVGLVIHEKAITFEVRKIKDNEQEILTEGEKEDARDYTRKSI